MQQLPLRLGRTVALAMVIGLGIVFVIRAVIDPQMTDAAAYWQAAWRIREGEALYPAVGSIEASNVYRYAPWFAFAAVPFTFLPAQLAGWLWGAILLAASTLAVAPFAQRGEWILVAFFWPILVGISAIGNVQALVVAALVLGVERRSGPLWIALAASLKATPVLLALVYLGRRQWWRFGLTVALTALLVGHAFVFDLSGYVTDAGQAALLFGWPAVYVPVVSVLALASVALASSRWAWLTTVAAATLALPRFLVYDVTLMAVGAVPATRAPADA